MEPVEEILLKEGYSSKEEIIRENALIIALTKAEFFRSECELFKSRYGSTISEFDKLLHTEKGEENFKKEEDYEDWEFAESALIWWTKRISEIKDASKH
jgi:hypothetical protein